MSEELSNEQLRELLAERTKSDKEFAQSVIDLAKETEQGPVPAAVHQPPQYVFSRNTEFHRLESDPHVQIKNCFGEAFGAAAVKHYGDNTWLCRMGDLNLIVHHPDAAWTSNCDEPASD